MAKEIRQGQTKSQTKKPLQKQWWFWVIIAVVVVAVAGGAASMGNKDKSGTSSSSTSTSSTTGEKKDSYSVGETVEMDGQAMTVTGVEDYDSGNQYITPDEGKKFLKVNITIENKSDEKKSYNAFYWKIEDSNGSLQDYSSSGALAAQADDDLGSGELVTGGKRSGSIVFAVPTDDSGLKLHYTPGLWSNEEIIFNL